MSKMVSLRLPDDVAEWVESYRQGRGWSRAELIGAALRSFREDCEGGVPEVIVPPASSVVAPIRPTPSHELPPLTETQRAKQEMRAAIAARQHKLNEAKGRAS
jgi:Arc/MetJ-type ribon-helix-helix transcriptional regulator